MTYLMADNPLTAPEQLTAKVALGRNWDADLRLSDILTLVLGAISFLIGLGQLFFAYRQWRLQRNLLAQATMKTGFLRRPMLPVSVRDPFIRHGEADLLNSNADKISRPCSSQRL